MCRLISILILCDAQLCISVSGKIEESDAVALLHGAFENYVLRDGIKNKQDKEGNSVLHIVAMTKVNITSSFQLCDPLHAPFFIMSIITMKEFLFL